MKNKFIKTYWLGLILFSGGNLLNSCSDSMLEENVYTGTSQNNLIAQGETGCKILVDGIYKYVQYFSYSRGNNWQLAPEAGTDEFTLNWGFAITEWGGMQNFLNLNSGHYQPMEMYRETYKLIAQSNQVLISFGSKENDPAYSAMVAEARFWRAYAYYKLQNVFGAVPLITGGENLSSGIERTSAVTIRSFVESEMKNIENTLPSTPSNYGRPTKWAVKAFLARFYLNNKDWTKASQYAKDVIDNSGSSLQARYQDVFKIDANSEIILAVNQINQSDKGNKYVALSLESELRNALNIQGVSASNGYGMSNYFYSTFASDDQRIAPFDKNTKQGIAIAGVQYKADGTPVYGTPAAPETVQKHLNRVITFKFPLQENIAKGEDSDADFPLMRLGEIYLTYAEAQFQMGNTAAALQYINPIRTRAGLLPLTVLTLDDILNERGWETYHEGYRREDLLRFGKLLEKVELKYTYDFPASPYPHSGNINRELFPIPADAISLNPKLTQNPGY
ncbi:RagB/SusD family nutrient uptake outer membrane protein [Chryseobacterium sp. MEBOG06]|uniref:RagB/SusD family nutrient uptake outer membrane protein n=1 Tax=Chryseobacterium sp. MEBOG06 TaxID=2879938 RepID=UPI001F2A4E5E|nr:RagB/SusD family nutrient uptake outer membrane protein [Chryseobacterium sp. MEBOG06]UKB83164.1 RagB/SusD family nutrient uptake outer membrane protein [Chryseobacterium sp. MEBOG06]